MYPQPTVFEALLGQPNTYQNYYPQGYYYPPPPPQQPQQPQQPQKDIFGNDIFNQLGQNMWRWFSGMDLFQVSFISFIFSLYIHLQYLLIYTYELM